MIHPDVRNFIELARAEGFNGFSKEAVIFLASKGATSTQITFVFYQGYQISIDTIDALLRDYLYLFENESNEDVIYETLLYDSYDPEDPNFKADENMIRFTMKSKDDLDS
jgi:hypothetical protein